MTTAVLEAVTGQSTAGTRTARPRIWIVCSGAGRVRRGFETYATDLFDQLRADGALDVTLVKGGGDAGPRELRLRCIHRDAPLNRAVCAIVGTRKRYVVEYLSFCLAMLPRLLASPPHVIYVLEGPIYRFLRAWRRRTGTRCQLVHFTGGQLAPLPADGSAYLHHVTPCSLESREAAAFAPERQFVLPHFVDLRQIPEPRDPSRRAAARARLGLPADRQIVLSVGNLDVSVKRMDYLVREVAMLTPRPYLVMLGQRDPDTPRLAGLAESLLGADGHRLATVPRHEVWEYYAAADAFVLASQREGFGLVFLEALASGLPVVAHEFAESRFVLGEHGVFADLTRAGALADVLPRVLAGDRAPDAARRRAYVRDRFDWSALGPEYVRVFRRIADGAQP